MRSWRFVLYFLTARSLSLAQEREGREGRRKDIFFGPAGQQKHAFLRDLGDLGGSFFFCSSVFLTARSLSLAQEREGREGRRKDIFLALRAIKHVFLSVLCDLRGSFFFAVQFLNRPLAALAQGREGREGRRKGIFFGPSGHKTCLS